MKTSIANFVILLYLMGYVLSCEDSSLDKNQFTTLMQNVAEGWSTQNTTLALSSFTEDAIYMQPPDVQFYQGHAQLHPYFGALTEEYSMIFHNLWFDKNTQTGAGEFTFSYGKDTADVGIAIVELERGKIKFWREYIIKGPSNFEEFIKTEDKDWVWHIGNYPEPKDTFNQ